MVWPGLVRGDVWITGEPTDVYNCVAFSMGYTDRWIREVSPLSAFEALYDDYGFTVTPYAEGTVDGFGSPDSGPDRGKKMYHASRLSPDPRFSEDGLWESKLGPQERITHGRNQLCGDVYGSILTSFSPSAGRIRLPDMEPELTAEERRALHGIAVELIADAALSDEFTRRREAFLAAVAASPASRIEAFAEFPEFTDLTALGERIVPLVVAQLDDPGGFFLLEVLDALAPSAAAVDHDPWTGLQSRARLVARAWLAAH
ncbi:hypothetical protein [Streptomyces sp. NPDC093094]|uniref:DUF7689 domain-containing protein n=1 Tax=Streptomyces sp. NPDC093094 TaxID=3366026 RepID=UPI0037F599A9